MSVLSFRKSFSELDTLAELRQTIQRTLTKSIESAAEYAPEINHSEAETMRAHLRQLAAKVSELSATQDFEILHASFRGELREHRDRLQSQVAKMREEVVAAVEAMNNLIVTVTSTGDDHERELKKEFRTLTTKAQASSIEDLRAAIAATQNAALKSCENAKRANQLVIAQLQDEIRSLHHEVERERKAALTDQETNLWNRDKLDSRTKDLMLLNEPFCVFLIGVCNLSTLARKYPPHLLQEAMKAIGARLKSLAGRDPMVGRWSQDVLAVIISTPLAGASLTVDRIQSRLIGPYSVQNEGVAEMIPMEIRVEAVDRPRGVGEAKFYPSLGQAAFNAVTSSH